MAATDPTTVTGISTLPKRWDGLNHTIPIFLRDIEDHLRRVGGYTLVVDGYFIRQNKLVVPNKEVARQIIDNKTVPSASSRSIGFKTPSTPSKSSTSPPVTLTDEEAKRFEISLEQCQNKDMQIETVILQAIEDRAIATDLRAVSNGSGCALIAALSRRHDDITTREIQSIMRKLHRMSDTGFTDPSPTGFNNWKSAFDDLTLCLPARHPLPDAIVATHYLTAVGALGDTIRSKVEIESRTTNAESDPTKMAAAIRTVLTTAQLDAHDDDSRAGSAHAFAASGLEAPAKRRARDPRKHRPATPRAPRPAPSEWRAGMRRCRNHGKHAACGDGQHLDSRCPAGAPAAPTASATLAAAQVANDQLLDLLVQQPPPDTKPINTGSALVARVLLHDDVAKDFTCPGCHECLEASDPRLAHPFYRGTAPSPPHAPLHRLVESIDDAQSYLSNDFAHAFAEHIRETSTIEELSSMPRFNDSDAETTAWTSLALAPTNVLAEVLGPDYESSDGFEPMTPPPSTTRGSDDDSRETTDGIIPFPDTAPKLFPGEGPPNEILDSIGQQPSYTHYGRACVAHQAYVALPQYYAVITGPARGVHYGLWTGPRGVAQRCNNARAHPAGSLMEAVGICLAFHGNAFVFSSSPNDMAFFVSEFCPPGTDERAHFPQPISAPEPCTPQHAVRAPEPAPPRRRRRHSERPRSSTTSPRSLFPPHAAAAARLRLSLIHMLRRQARLAGTFAHTARSIVARYARALCARVCPSTAPSPPQKPVKPAAVVRAVLDSGCTWSVHPYYNQLVNLRPCHDNYKNANGDVYSCKWMGDLPVASLDKNGKIQTFTIRDVRCMPEYTDTLLSVHQLWHSLRANAVFGDQNTIKFQEGFEIPFKWDRGLYHVHLIPGVHLRQPPRGAPARACTFRGARSHSHVDRFTANDAARFMHRRLHLGLVKLKGLAHHTADAPRSLALATTADCDACAVANARSLPHPEIGYSPSRVGSLIYTDDAGPHEVTALGGAKYFRVFVDAHSRYRLVYLMRARTDGFAVTQRFLAEFHKIAHASADAKLVACIVSDNAPELVSEEFNSLMRDRAIRHITSPAHIKQPNGVAERSISALRSVARSAMQSSNAPPWAWGVAVLHAEDVLNHCSGPSDSAICRVDGITSYQLLTSSLPHVMGIMPFGCAAIAVKPKVGPKTPFAPRGAEGINLGRSREVIGAYRVWVPAQRKIVVTSDVTFNEDSFPWNPSPRVNPADARPPTASHTCPDQRPRRRVILHLFSGPYNRPDGLSAQLRRLGFNVLDVDNAPSNGGDTKHDLLNDQFFTRIVTAAESGSFSAVFAAPPCSTFSISRFFDYKGPNSPDRGPPPVRDRDNILGLPNVPDQHQAELRNANKIVARTAHIIDIVATLGGQFIIENPADRGDPSQPVTYDASLEKHGPIWLMPCIAALKQKHQAKSITFAQCMFGSPFQKYTTLLYSPLMFNSLKSFENKECSHDKGQHTTVMGRSADGTWVSETAAAYPTKLATALAESFANLAPADARPAPTSITITDPIEDSAIHNEANDTRTSPPQNTSVNQLDSNGANMTSPAATGPRPDGSGFQLRPRHGYRSTSTNQTAERCSGNPLAFETIPEIATQPTPAEEHTPVASDTPDYVPFDESMARSPTLATSAKAQCEEYNSFCIIVPSSNVGRALQALRLPDDAQKSTSGSKKTLDPRNRKEALAQNREGWLKSESKEMGAHNRNQTWSIIEACDVPTGRRLIRMLWVYKVKRDGTLKSRLCVQGSSQKLGEDFDQTYCATMRATSLRLLGAVSVALSLNMRRIDFISAYLQGKLEEGEVVYCHMPEGYATYGKDGRKNVLRVEKPIYGLAQAGRRWQRSLFPWLKDHGFTQSQFDPCVFFYRKYNDAAKRDEIIIIGCYVDDLLTCVSHDDDKSLFKQFYKDLARDWEVEDEGEAVDLLNVHFKRTARGLILHQRPYIENMIEKYLPQGVPASFQRNATPCDSQILDLVQSAMQSSESPDPSILKQYQSLVGALLYCATMTRPDITFAVGMLCRAMSKPSAQLLDAARRVLFYLSRHSELGLHYEGEPNELCASSDANWAVKHSTSGWLVNWMRATISYGSKRQHSVALSSCQAEIVAASEASKEVKFQREFLGELGFPQLAPTPLLVDNQAAIDLSYNPEFHNRTKHIDRRHFYVRELVEEHVLNVMFVKGTDNLADFFTKPLPGKTFFKLRDTIMNVTD